MKIFDEKEMINWRFNKKKIEDFILKNLVLLKLWYLMNKLNYKNNKYGLKIKKLI